LDASGNQCVYIFPTETPLLEKRNEARDVITQTTSSLSVVVPHTTFADVASAKMSPAAV
jgi:hypothetical protein